METYFLAALSVIVMCVVAFTVGYKVALKKHRATFNLKIEKAADATAKRVLAEYKAQLDRLGIRLEGKPPSLDDVPSAARSWTGERIAQQAQRPSGSALHWSESRTPDA